MALIDQKEIANIIAQEFYSQFFTLDGLNSGVPTKTTPTLTPTTLRNIEQTFIELQCEAESHQNEARFVPPLVHSIGNNQYISASEADNFSIKSNSVWHSSLSQSSSDSNNRPTPPLTPASISNELNSSSNTGPTTTTRRNMGGRKPSKPTNISPEEEERRILRRERNKMAAARCRKRRVDHTNQLLEETEGLEQKKQQLQAEILQLQNDRDELEFILENHRACCRLHQQTGAARPVSPPDVKPFTFGLLENKFSNGEPKVKTELVDDSLGDNLFSHPSPAKKLMLNSMAPSIMSKPSRPSSLNVPTTFGISHKTTSVSEATGVPISTPSTGIPFNFDSLMDGGTGLTPVSAPLVPSCSSQQRNLPAVDLSSPDAGGPPKLVSL